MRHDFSAQFLRILPPDTSFGEAWESLCYTLLCEELGEDGLIRLRPPDRGIDILCRRDSCAYQCKSNERGAFGTIPPDHSINSLRTALQHRAAFKWNQYCFATNANYTGAGLEKIIDTANELGFDAEMVEFRGPDYWDRLCTEHFDKVEGRFNYRISATEKQVIDAFRSARYYDRYVSEYAERIKQGNFSLVITNNRTPVKIEIPFSPELSVENYLDVAKELLGISLDWTNFSDLNTSAGSSLSVTIGQKTQPFSAKIGDLPIEPGEKLELWITLVWRDELRKEGVGSDEVYKAYDLLSYPRFLLTVSQIPPDRGTRRKLTIEREEAIVQAMIWKGAHQVGAETSTA